MGGNAVKLRQKMTKVIFSRISSFLLLTEEWMLGKLSSCQNHSGGYDESYHKQYWNKVAACWDITPIPVRPSEHTVEIYRSFLQKNVKGNGDQKVLILGSTPELRDLVAVESSAKIYVADFSNQMLLAMLRFTKHVDLQKEEWIKSNWLDLPFPEQFFDVVVGDLVLQQFPPENEPIFLKKVRNLLKSDGVFISRFQFLDKTYYNEENLAEVINKTFDATLGDRQTISLLKLRVIWLYADLEKRTLNRQVAVKGLAAYMKRNNLDDPRLRGVLRLLLSEKDSLRNWSPPEEKELTDILSRYFTISEIKIASDHEDARYFPIIMLSKAV